MQIKSPYSEEEIFKLKQAYHMLGVQFESSAPAIKRVYWRLAKQWHPDKNRSDFSLQKTATERMKELNEAYSRIRHAPLRYHIETFPQIRQSYIKTQKTSKYCETLPITDYFEIGVRFVCGCLFGLLLTMNLMLYDVRWITVSGFVLTFLCGYCAVRFGDRFWHWILGKAWLLW